MAVQSTTGFSSDEEKLTFILNLPDIQRLIILYDLNISGKLEAIKDALDSGLTQCLSSGQHLPIRNLMEDLKTFQQTWADSGKFLTIDKDTQTWYLRLMEIREMALQLMLANKVNSRLKNSHLLTPQPASASKGLNGPDSSAPTPLPRLLKQQKSQKPQKPQKPPKTLALKALSAMNLGRHQTEAAAWAASTAAGAAAPPPGLSAAPSAVSDSTESEASTSDANEHHSPQLDLRKTFYSDDILGGDGASASGAAAAATAAAADQKYKFANALEELIATERKYTRRMELLCSHYLPSLCKDLPHMKDQLSEVFHEFGIFHKLHQELLGDLEQMSEEADGKQQKFQVGKVMGKYGPHLRLYSSYYTKYKLHLNQINDWMKDEATKAAFQRARSEGPDPEDRMLDVTSHMLESVQRPLRYPMLLGCYLKQIGDSHPDYQQAHQALTNIEKVTNGFNVKVHEVENLQKLLVILREVAFPAELQEEKERFICSQYQLSAKVLKISSTNRQQIRFLILSSAVLLLCEVNALNWKTVQRAVSVDKDLMLTLDEKLSADYPNCIRLQTHHKTYDLSFATPEEFDDWIAAFKRLGVTFGDSNATDEKFPWKTFNDESVGRKPPMKLKDHDVSQCQACTVTFTVFNRRHHCRLCGGIFCGECSKYKVAVAFESGGPLKRSCFFCKDRVDRRDRNGGGVLEKRHRDLIERFDKRQAKAGGALIQGYLNVRIDVLQPKMSKSPRFLQDHWSKMWCTADRELFSIYRMKKDFVPAHSVVLALNVSAELSEDGSEIQLKLKPIDTCRLRMTEDSGLRSAEREASHLHEWFDILKAGTQTLQQ